MITEIYSKDNPTFKQVKQLLKKKYRDQYKQYIIEGVRIILDAYENNKNIDYIVYCDDIYKTAGGEEALQLFIDNNYRIYKVSSKMYSEITDTSNPQGIMAVIPIEKYKDNSFLKKKNALVVILDRVQDPGNLGTILRTADAAGADGVFLTKGCVDLYNLKTIRATMGSIYHIPVINNAESEKLIRELKAENFELVCTSLETEKYYFDIDLTSKIAIVIGNEANGVLPSIINDSNHVIKIPMEGKAESLNAAVAASIIMYEAFRQKYSQKI